MSGRPFVIGVTGGIATGKSTVMAILARLGAECIDADRVYHGLIQPGSPLWERLRRKFGDGIIGDDGQIDRNALGKVVFASADKLALLDELTHPAVVEAIGSHLAQTEATVVAIEAVKLVESGMQTICDEVWLVVSDPGVQRTRLMDRSGLPAEEVERRLAAQPDEGDRRALADLVIDNSGSVDELRATITARFTAIRDSLAYTGATPILPK